MGCRRSHQCRRYSTVPWNIRYKPVHERGVLADLDERIPAEGGADAAGSVIAAMALNPHPATGWGDGYIAIVDILPPIHSSTTPQVVDNRMRRDENGVIRQEGSMFTRVYRTCVWQLLSLEYLRAASIVLWRLCEH